MAGRLTHRTNRGGISGPSVFPLSAAGRYLQTAAGDPFLIHGDTPWSLAAQLTDAEVDQYIDDRASRGFTALLINAPEFFFTSQTPRTNNVDGVAPFTSMTGNYNWTINNAYWVRVDRIVDRCRVNNMAVIINPAYWGYNGGTQGCYTQVQAQSDATLQAYGAALANRYTQGNVIWCLGGDYAGADAAARTKQWQIVVGIRSVRTSDIVMAHPEPGGEGYSYWSGETGWSLNTTYTYDAADANGDYIYNECSNAYGRAGPIPFIFMEGRYEGEPNPAVALSHLRRQSYGAMLSGACGQLFGNNPIWHFESPESLYTYTGTWESNLGSTGAVEQQYVKSLFAAYSWWLLRPKTDTSLVSSSLSTGQTRLYPALASDGTFAMIYVPSSQTVTVVTNALTGVAGNVRIRLYDPTAGTYSVNQASVAKGTGQSVATGGERIIVVDAA